MGYYYLADPEEFIIHKYPTNICYVTKEVKQMS